MRGFFNSEAMTSKLSFIYKKRKNNISIKIYRERKQKIGTDQDKVRTTLASWKIESVNVSIQRESKKWYRQDVVSVSINTERGKKLKD